MTAACLASFGVLAGVLATLYGLGWYKNRKRTRRSIREINEDDAIKQSVAEQLA